MVYLSGCSIYLRFFFREHQEKSRKPQENQENVEKTTEILGKTRI